MKVLSMFRKGGVIPVTIAATIALFLVVSAVQATTTISTDITTEGALNVTGVSTFTGKAVMGNASSTLLSNSGASWFTGDTTLGHASTTQLTSSGTVWITTSNSATSTLSVGCIQTTATSTATPIKLTLFATSTVNIDGASVTSGFGGSAVQGFVLWAFGSCP
ncbi:MAG: hypothetical protein Q7S75_00920 [bacterium]|nr:hypothetical protein [bacterium]